MAELTISVTAPGANHMGAPVRIFTRTVPNGLAWPLRQGDRLQCLRSDSEWFADMPVHHVWRQADGSVSVAMSTVYQDPGEEMQRLINQQHGSSLTDTYLGAWWTERDGLLPDLLLASGWTEWQPS